MRKLDEQLKCKEEKTPPFNNECKSLFLCIFMLMWIFFCFSFFFISCNRCAVIQQSAICMVQVTIQRHLQSSPWELSLFFMNDEIQFIKRDSANGLDDRFIFIFFLFIHTRSVYSGRQFDDLLYWIFATFSLFSKKKLKSIQH